MPIARELLDEYVARLNKQRKPDEAVAIAAYEPPGRFALSYPNRPMPEGQCIDADFTEIQFALFEERNVTTAIIGGQHDPETDRYVMVYEVVEWD